MVFAEYLAGIAFNNASLGYVHALAHQLGGFYNLPHGLCNAILLPAVMKYNLPAAITKYADLARAAGINTTNQSSEVSANQFIAQVQQLNKELGLPARLSELRGFKPEDIPLLAENALKDVCCQTNPRQGSQQDIEDIYQSIL